MSDSLRRADADDTPDGAGPRGPLDAERRALTPEETANIAAMSTGRTHFDGCWQHTTHGDCARARVQQLEEALAARDAELGRARALLDEARLHLTHGYLNGLAERIGECLGGSNDNQP
jgi:hypothetical protein